MTTLEHVKFDDPPNNFIEVEMPCVIRLRNHRLICALAVSEYLNQVAPVPFSLDFRFDPKLSQALSAHVDLGELEIRITDAYKPICRPHRNSMGLNEKSVLCFDELGLVEIPSINDNIAAVAWVLNHEYEGTLPTGKLVKGLRLSTSSIQVSGPTLLEDLFSVPRFNSWSMWEVHVFDRRIIPNGHRD